MTKRLLREPELMAYLGVGRATARRFGAEAGAVVRFGRRIAYDKQAIDDAIDKKMADQAQKAESAPANHQGDESGFNYIIDPLAKTRRT